MASQILLADKRGAGGAGSIPELGRSPGDGSGYPTPVFLLGESHGQRSLMGYSLWGRKESDRSGHTRTCSEAVCLSGRFEN